MERLTYRDSDGTAMMKKRGGWQGEGIARLAAYEDTRLEPEEVNRCKLTLMGKSVAEITEFEGVPIERLKQLVKADKEGRLVVLPPAKDGDPKPKCFYTDNQSIWCLGMAPVYGDEPVERCKQCWYCEAGYAREEAERALEGGTDDA